MHVVIQDHKRASYLLDLCEQLSVLAIEIFVRLLEDGVLWHCWLKLMQPQGASSLGKASMDTKDMLHM